MKYTEEKNKAGDFAGAKRDYISCLSIVEQTSDTKLKAHILEALGRLYLNSSFSEYNPEQAIAYFNEALALASDCARLKTRVDLITS